MRLRAAFGGAITVLALAACSSFSSSGGASPPDAGLDGAAEAAPAADASGADAPDEAATDAGTDAFTCPAPLTRVAPAPSSFSCAEAGAPFLCADFDEATPTRYILGVAGAIGAVSAGTTFDLPAASPDYAMHVTGGGGFETTLPTVTDTTALDANLDFEIDTPPVNAGSFFTIAIGNCDVNLKFEKLPARLGVDSHCGNAFYDHHDLTTAYPTDNAFHHFTLAVDVCRSIASASYDGQPPSVFGIAPTIASGSPRVTISPPNTATVAYDDVLVVHH